MNPNRNSRPLPDGTVPPQPPSSRPTRGHNTNSYRRPPVFLNENNSLGIRGDSIQHTSNTRPQRTNVGWSLSSGNAYAPYSHEPSSNSSSQQGKSHYSLSDQVSSYPAPHSRESDDYQYMQTPIESNKTPADPLAMNHLEESSDGSFDDGTYRQDRVGPPEAPQDGLGWFHAKIKVDNSIQWANNYKIQAIMFSVLIMGAVLTIIFAGNSSKSSVGLLCGSIITIVCTTSVIYTFLTRPAWRKHPNPIIFFRSICDLCLVLVLLTTELYQCANGKCGVALDGAACSVAAAFTQLFLWASESWFFVMAIDMLSSLQSPFTDYRRNVRRYHIFVWFTAIVTVILLVSIPDFAGTSQFGYCWTNSTSKLGNDEGEKPLPYQVKQEDGDSSFWDLNFQSWVLFYIWLILFWLYAITVIYRAYRRVHSGISETLRMRLRVLHSVTLYVIAIIIYWGLTFTIYVPYMIIDELDRPSWINQLMRFMITCKGYFDFVVWFQMNDFQETAPSATAPKKKKGDVDVDVDLSPQVNLALRCEVLYYTTTGIIQAVRDTQHLPPDAAQQELYLQPQGTEDNRGSLGVEEYMIRTKPKAALNKGTLFIDYNPHTFQTIREHFGIDTEQYIESLSRTTKERLSEGASGAFMFFSLDQQLIVKSMSEEEAHFLRSIAQEYATFLMTNPDSLLTRFYGCHAIRLYGNTFYFVVMANLFSTDKVIHRRYDLKGSWVNRSANHPSKGKRVTCRHCNAKFVFGSSDAEGCRARVGRHEPNVVLKDNDLTARVRLDPKAAEELYDQVAKDANFLSRTGIMDYSLLLGVHNVEYMVNPDLEEEDGAGPIVDSNGRERYPVPGNQSNFTDASRPILEQQNSNVQQGLPRLATGTKRANTVVGPSIYYFGMIDILQTWNMDKKVERFAKTRFLGKDPDGLSAMPPAAYCDRFKRKMAEILGVAVQDEYADLFSEGHSSNGGHTNGSSGEFHRRLI